MSPYVDHEKQKAYLREYARKKREEYERLKEKVAQIEKKEKQRGK